MPTIDVQLQNLLPRIKRMAHSLMRNIYTPGIVGEDDLVQEGMIAAAKMFSEVEDQNTTYVMNKVRWAMLEHIRFFSLHNSRRSLGQTPRDFVESDSFEEGVDVFLCEAENVYDDLDRKHDFLYAFSHLKPQQKEAVSRHIGGEDMQEIGKSMSCSTAYVSQLCSQAKEKMARVLS